jgi:carbon-monoxide dehydrogenase large subunit
VRESIVGKFVGARVKRREDLRLLTGRGRYIDDVVVPDMLHAAFLRSSNPHATLGPIDTSAATALPGVVAVFTGADMQRMTNPMMGMMVMEGLYDPWYWALAVDKVRHVGDPVAIVIAESRAVAEDGCELIEVDYESLDPIATREHTLDPNREPLWPLAGGNVVYDATEDLGDVDGAFAGAARVVKATFHQHRHANQPMETRGMVVEMSDGAMVIHASHQASHNLKWGIALCLERTPMREVARQMWIQRDRMKKVVTGAAAFLKARPGLIDAQKASLPVMMKANRRDPGRASWSTRSMLALIAKDPSTMPEVAVHDVGGAFGAKTTMLREEVALAAAARELGRSIKWIEDRNEHLTCGGQAREESIDVEAAVTENGIIKGLKVSLVLDQGAYPGFPFGGLFFSRVIRTMFPGPYRVPTMRFRSRVVASNKGTYVAYRGPWAMETWTRERLLDVIARELGITRAEVRLRNMIGPDELPNQMITGPALDIRMSAKATLERALEVAEFDSWAQMQAAARAEGRYLGLGIATYIEAAPGPPGYFNHAMPGFADMVGAEPALTVLEADGSITLHTQQVPHGQGHETTMAQIAADELGVPVEAVTLKYGDTRTSPFGTMGTGGSRSAAMHGGANALSARAMRKEIVAVAAGLLEADPADIDITDGVAHVRGVPSAGRTLAEIATEAKRLGVGKREHSRAIGDEAIRVSRGWDGGEGGWAQSTHVCWVEVDLETGFVKIPRYAVVEDCGEIINPAIVDGQVRGGVAQGVGAVLYERSSYDESGQMTSGTFMDYLIPTVSEIPEIEIHHVETPSDIQFNYRGVGEGGMIGSPAAITNAIEDALGHLGAQVREQHLPPSRILELAGVTQPD